MAMAVKFKNKPDLFLSTNTKKPIGFFSGKKNTPKKNMRNCNRIFQEWRTYQIFND